MTHSHMNPETPSELPPSELRCGRVRLLLSIAFDEAATAQQLAEIDAHVPACAECRAAQAVNTAVRERVAIPASVPSDFAARVTAGVVRQRLETRAQNRFLVGAAVAAVLVASVSLLVVDGGPMAPRHAPGSSGADGTPREIAGGALRAGLAFGRAPLLCTEDR